MFQRLRRQLTLMYALTTGIILTIVTVAVIISTQKELKAKNIESFKTNLNAIETVLQTSTVIKYTWLADNENANNLLIHIEDNARPLNYNGYGYENGIRENLVSQVKALGAKDGIEMNKAPIFSNKISSNIYQIEDENKTRYLAAIEVLKGKDGFRSIILLQYFPLEYNAFRNKIFIFIFYVAGILSLYLVSWKFVGKSLKPVEENRKRQTQFIAAASHELKAPLAVIQTSASALYYQENQEKFIGNIERECVRLSKLIEDMLLLASTDAKNWSVCVKRLHVDTLLIDAFEALESYCRQKEYQLEIKLPKDFSCQIDGDKERLLQVLMILVDNALSYANARADKRIVIQAYEKRNYIYIEVIDFGEGIEDAKKPYLFERFFRGDESRNQKEHFGLGLSIAKEIVELHAGLISVSDTTGGGATFTIKLKKAY